MNNSLIFSIKTANEPAPTEIEATIASQIKDCVCMCVCVSTLTYAHVLESGIEV